MNESAGQNWIEQGNVPNNNESYYDQNQEQQYVNENSTNEYLIQQQEQNTQLNQQVTNQDLFDDDDEDGDILDEMEDDGNNNDDNDNNQKMQAQPLLMKFCPHDSSLLYPKEDKRNRTLRFACGLCRYSEVAQMSMVYQNVMKQEVKNVLHKVLSAVSDDPALPRTSNENCESCGFNEAVFFQSDTSDVRNDTLALIFVCCNCGHKWVK